MMTVSSTQKKVLTASTGVLGISSNYFCTFVAHKLFHSDVLRSENIPT